PRCSDGWTRKPALQHSTSAKHECLQPRATPSPRRSPPSRTPTTDGRHMRGGSKGHPNRGGVCDEYSNRQRDAGPVRPHAVASVTRLRRADWSQESLTDRPVRKPDRQWFVRVHPDPTWRLDTPVLHLKEERETYLVDPSLWTSMPGELVPTALLTAVNRQEG